MKNERGSVLLMALGAGTLILVIGAGMTSWYTNALKAGQKFKMDASVKVIQHRLVSAVDNDYAWSITVNRNAALACYRTGGADCAGAQGPIEVFAIDGSIVAGQVNSTTGFALDGEVCNTFRTTGDDDCPFQLDVRFRTVCPAPPCTAVMTNLGRITVAQDPPVEINAAVIFKPQNWEKFQTFNPEFHRTVFLRGHKKNQENYMKTMCEVTFRGQFNDDTRRCNIPILKAGNCPPNFHLGGVNPDGSQFCKRADMTNVHCKKMSANPLRATAIVGFAEWGEPICGKFEK